MTIPSSATPTGIEWTNLIQAGRDLLNWQQLGGPPTDEHIRRAVSNAYYAMFHSLAHNNASALIGTPIDPATAAAWSRVYRGLEHTTARRELQRHHQQFSPQAKVFADTFIDMQDLRHSADYDPNTFIAANDGSVYLDLAESAILGFAQVAFNERVYIATLTLVRPR